MTAQHQQRSGAAGIPDMQVQPVPGGYVLRGTDGPALPLQLSQGIFVALGASLAGLMLLLVLPWDAEALGGGPLRTGLAVLLGGAAFLLLWFGTRGGVAELHLDLARGELREFVRHRIGRPTLVGCHALLGGPRLEIDRTGSPDAPCALLLRTGGEGGLCIAQGSEAAILDLHRRLDAKLRQPQDAGFGAGPLAA